MTLPKYARWEIERRFLVRPDHGVALETLPFSDITDRYIDGARLRLRTMRTGDVVEYKLGKKYPPLRTSAGAVTNIYLTPEEHAVFAALPAHTIEKRRYRTRDRGQLFAIDCFQGALAGLILAEAETEDEASAAALDLPDWLGPEVTADEAFTGGALCRANPVAVLNRARQWVAMRAAPRAED